MLGCIKKTFKSRIEIQSCLLGLGVRDRYSESVTFLERKNKKFRIISNLIMQKVKKNLLRSGFEPGHPACGTKTYTLGYGGG